MGTGALKNRAAERRIGAGIEINIAVERGKDSVLVAAEGKRPFHRVALWMKRERFFA